MECNLGAQKHQPTRRGNMSLFKKLQISTKCYLLVKEEEIFLTLDLS